MRYFVILFFSAFLLLSSGCCNCGKLFTVLMNSVNEKKSIPSQITPMPSEEPTESTNNTEDGDETLSQCEKNLKNIATACEMYATDYNVYPPSLAYLVGNNSYLKAIPTCPAAGKDTYSETYEKEGDSISLYCSGENHKDGGIPENYPAYNTEYGIVYKDNNEISPEDSSGISQKNNVLETINKHYDAINNRAYKDAYNLRTSAWKAETPYNDFYENWKSNVNIIVVSTEVSSQTDTKAVVRIRLYSEDTEAGGDKIGKSYYSGTVELVNEDGNWLINDVKINQEK